MLEVYLDRWPHLHTSSMALSDCFTYALSADRDLPVLCTGQYVHQTDLTVVGTDQSER